jgi:hypothetical protein
MSALDSISTPRINILKLPMINEPTGSTYSGEADKISSQYWARVGKNCTSESGGYLAVLMYLTGLKGLQWVSKRTQRDLTISCNPLFYKELRLRA